MVIKSDHHLMWGIGAFSVLFVAAHLIWQSTHGGIISHHLLDQRSMPAISNWWGVAIVPLVGLLAAWSLQRRALIDTKASRKAALAALGALVVGVALSLAFLLDGSGNAPLVVALAALVSGVVLPIYRAEYSFGFVIGMSFVFGLVLPAFMALIAATISAALHFGVWPAIRWALARARA